ncbi:hypothetical protein [Gordonia sihwensis]|uniref:hypothetical protein n=1 Tax=Gordonia sihwensis TaxID=173559 RepID=UPI0024161275|nr:hypothetical protein [Gordonia sihwensis]WFN93475.1 hypothetical protein P5P27_02555 [Gordonia sihwensis]
MPSNKTKKSTAPAVEPEAIETEPVERIDLASILEVGTPGTEPVPVTIKGVDFSINRYFSPDTVWAWSDLQRADPSELTPSEVAEGNRAVLKILLPEEDHDKIEELLAILDTRSIAESRRIFLYINNLAGLVDRQGNALAL